MRLGNNRAMVNLVKDVKSIRRLMCDSGDLVVREIPGAGVAAVYFDGMLNLEGLERSVVEPIVRSGGSFERTEEGVRNLLYTGVTLRPETALADTVVDIASGECLLLIEGCEQYFVLMLRKLPVRPVISAFTATATKEVRDDVIDILLLEDPVVVATGFNRPNLYFGVQAPKDKYAAVKSYVECHPNQSGIIYCLTRKLVEEVCARLRGDGFAAVRYHAGLTDEERRDNQDAFMYDAAPIMVATNAFGMGIDKSNVRYVLHYNMPKNLESYYQEAGRAGRDGAPAECILFYGGQDVVTNQMFIEHNRDNEELDPVTRLVVMERDRERLKKMTYYCFTSHCLRDYILRYFGESGKNDCGNCSNCLARFEEQDVTKEAAAMIACVRDCGQRYGMGTILDTLHGANTARIRQYRLEENPQYGVLSKVPAQRLRQIGNHLLLTGYLATTNDEYAIVKLTPLSNRVTDKEEAIRMKFAKEAGQEERQDAGESASRKKAKKSAAAGLQGEADEVLFGKLKKLRFEIAREEKVPPYIVFSDKTLLLMCAAKPGTKEEMLAISGVGEYKFAKYGERFLECIAQR